MKPAILHTDAEAELWQAADYYENRRPGLGGEFRREFEAGLQRVRENPQAYAAEDDPGVRYCSLHGFPYRVVPRTSRPLLNRTERAGQSR